MTKPRVSTYKAKAPGPAPTAGSAPNTPSSRRPQTQQAPRLPSDDKRVVPFDEAVTEPRVPYLRRRSNEPPTEAANGDDDQMNQPQTVMPG